ncbi:hypothetical protein QR680_009984 [Steinernema hermaphroditum]|uniref:7TM GPCR serpentine receptor class x (Srx) domain-containing protein n=1 Tax=Steinernema hermaphroditum TaxID=289476 RepID=A0AA39MAY0_9BILA|nr:hypothetical protein QR680_009984 [Steinernema hermaphroditum]
MDKSVTYFENVGRLVVGPVGLLVYLRIIFLLFSRPSYRTRECYHIMIHIGIVQCLYAPGVVFYCAKVVLEADIWNLDAVTLKLCSSVVRMEAVMNVVLAMNRLKVMLGLRYHSYLHTLVIVCAWMLGVLNFGLLFSPWYDYFITNGEAIAHYDMSKSLTPLLVTVGIVIIVGSSIISLLIYSVIVAYLVKAKKAVGTKLEGLKEKRILVYALVKFVFDSLLTCGMYGFLPLPQSAVVDGYVVNNLLIPPALLLILNGDIRKDFLPFNGNLLVSVSSLLYTV